MSPYYENVKNVNTSSQ